MEPMANNSVAVMLATMFYLSLAVFAGSTLFGITLAALKWIAKPLLRRLCGAFARCVRRLWKGREVKCD